MPYCSNGDLNTYIRKRSCSKQYINVPHHPTLQYNRMKSDMSTDTTSSTHPLNCSTNEVGGLNEAQARVWFRQLLDALLHLQRKGVCHRDIRLDNLVLEANGKNLVLIDFGLALRVPYADSSNYGGVSDVSEGIGRLLMISLGQSGNLMYVPPEVIANEPFDGFAADIWSAGVVLFVLLIGLAPFKWAHNSDVRYAQIMRGQLKDLIGVQSPGTMISDAACDLLQNMMWSDPQQRLTLAQILQHPWVVGPASIDGESTDIPSESRLDVNVITDKDESRKMSPSPPANKKTVYLNHDTICSMGLTEHFL